MFNKIFEFIKVNFKTIVRVSAGLFLLYWIVFVLTPKAGLSPEEKQKLDSLNTQIKVLQEQNSKLESDIQNYNNKIDEIDDNIGKIKNQKTIIKEIYHEKINGVDKLTILELDTFFTKRYNY